MSQIDREKSKDALNGAKEKAKAALSEIKANFKADEGAEGLKKYQGMFKNLWKSGTTGKATLVAASIVVLLLFKSIFFGGGNGDVGEGFDDSTSEDVDTLVMKGLYMRQPGDEALKACQKIVSSSKDLVVVDFRNGIEREKDEATKAAEKKEYEKNVAQAKEDVESFFKWYDYNGKGFDLKEPSFRKSGDRAGLVKLESNGKGSLVRGCYSVGASVFMLAAHFNYQVEWMLPVKKSGGGVKFETGVLSVPKKDEEAVQHFMYTTMANIREGSLLYGKIKEKGLEMDRMDTTEAWFRLALKDANGGEVAKDDVAKNWLVARGYYPPSDKEIIPKENLIEIAIREDGKREDQLKGLCFVWIDDEGKVKEVYFKEDGMSRIFNAGDLSTEEFAQALLKNYSDIPSFEADVKISNEAEDGSMRLKTYTWIYKDPRGFQVKLLDSAYYDHHGQRINMKAYSNMQSETGIGARILAKDEKRWFDILAIKPESARKFD